MREKLPLLFRWQCVIEKFHNRLNYFFLKSFKTGQPSRVFADEPSQADAEQEAQTAQGSAETVTVQPATQTEPVAIATAAEPTRIVSVPLPPTEDVKNKKGLKKFANIAAKNVMFYILYGITPFCPT